MFASLVRQLARESHVGEAAEKGSTAVILRILQEHGPCNKRDVWKLAEAAGVKSITHTKEMLQLLRKSKEIKVQAIPKTKETTDLDSRHSAPQRKGKKRVPNPANVDKEFVYSIVTKE